MDQIISEIHGHPAVNGILIWSAWSPQGCYKMCLTDNNFKNLATGNVVDKYLGQFSHKGMEVTTDSNGFFTTSLYHGDYEAQVSDSVSTMGVSSTPTKFSVKPAAANNKESSNRTLKFMGN